MAENKKSPMKVGFLAGIGAALIPSLAGTFGATLLGGAAVAGGIGLATRGIRKKAKRRDRSNRANLDKYNRQFDKRIADYEKSEFQPLDADALRQENVYEDLTVNTQAADYAKEQFQQQQANIMQGMRGSLGSSGIAGFAQALSNQAADQSRQSQVTIGQQLAQNRKLALGEKSRLQDQQRMIQLANMQGARQFELDKMSTLIGVAGQRIGGAQGAIAQRQQMYGQIAGGIGNIAGAVIGASGS